MPPENEENKKRIKTKDDVKEIAEIADGIKADIKKGRIKAGKITRYPAGGRLYLEMSAAGGLHWRMKYRFDGKEKRLSFGAYPAMTRLSPFCGL